MNILMFTYFVKLQQMVRAYLVQQLPQNVTDYTRIKFLILYPTELIPTQQNPTQPRVTQPNLTQPNHAMIPCFYDL